MKASKELYSLCFKDYAVDKATLQKLQSTLLTMLVDIKKMCDDHHINFMLSGGTMLGAVRHKGFIPWDDDIDIMMTRNEYCNFRDAFDKALGEYYILVEPLSSPNYVSKMVKIYKKGTTYIEIPTAGVHGPNMIFIDLFIIENVPKPGIVRDIKALVYDFAFKAASVCIDYLYPSPVIEERLDSSSELKDYYTFRRKWGGFFTALGGIKWHLKVCDKLGNQKKKTGWLGIPSGISYKKEICEESVYTQLADYEFCGYTFKGPGQYDIYLKNLYGDYMKIPPVEKREFHVAYKLDFGEK